MGVGSNLDSSGHCQCLIILFRTRSIMRDHFGSRDVPKPGAIAKGQFARQSHKEPRRILIAGPCGIHNLLNRLCGNMDQGRIRAYNCRPFGPARNSRQRAILTQQRNRFVKIIGLIERQQFRLIRKHDIDMVANKMPEAIAVPIHAETVRQG